MPVSRLQHWCLPLRSVSWIQTSGSWGWSFRVVGPSFERYHGASNWRVSSCLELWKINNIFKIFLLSFVVVFLVLTLLLHNVVVARYLLFILIAGVAAYVALLVFPLLKPSGRPKTSQVQEEKRFPKTAALGAFVIVLLFVTSFVAIREFTVPTSGYQIMSFQFLTLPNGTALSMSPIRPSNQCGWLESMNVTTRQSAMQQGLQDCDYAWPHVNLSVPTLFLEFENFTELVYDLNSTNSPTSLTGIAILCFQIPSQSFQCWVPPARVSHLR